MNPQDTASAHYTVLARRFRPQTFSEVVGQGHVAQALKNAIAAGRVAHAYLFTGARGVGKTSMARILAKALNCPHASAGEPCNNCDICHSISAGQDVDVLEIDGASNRRIDDIRLLRSNVGVKPMRAAYKIYIIDEVHMLTNEAFNALLKTLEEPPPNVKFIFCTTEPTKVPDTILSRCQRFDFAAIDSQQIVQRLHEIAQQEGVAVDPAALELVARRARGSMRDSQSLFDQLLAYGGKTIAADDVHRLFGTASDERLIDLAQSVIAQQPAQALALLDRALADGIQLGELMDQMIDYYRDLMVVAAGAESTTLQAVAATNRPRLAEQAQRWGLPTILASLQILADVKTRQQRSGHGRTLAELALVRLALLESTLDLASLADELRAGKPSASSSPAAVPPRRVSVSRTVAEPPAPPPPLAKAVSSGTQPQAASENPVSRDAEPDESHQLDESGGEPESGPLLDRILNSLGAKDLLSKQLSKASAAAIYGPNQVEIVFPGHYYLCKDFCEQPAMAQRLEQVVRQVVGQDVRVRFRLEESAPKERPAKPATVSDRAVTSPSQPESPDPYAEKVRSIFGATIVHSESLPSKGRFATDGGRVE